MGVVCWMCGDGLLQVQMGQVQVVQAQAVVVQAQPNDGNFGGMNNNNNNTTTTTSSSGNSNGGFPPSQSMPMATATEIQDLNKSGYM